MKTLQRILFFVAVLGLSAFCFFQYRATNKLRDENESLRGQIDQLAHPENSGETAAPANLRTQEQLSELLKLRGEVTQLRGQTNQIARLAEENQKLVASFKELESSRTNSSAKKSPPYALPQDIHPKATWAYRGYGTPDATVETMLTAMVNEDKAAFLAGLSPEMRAKMEKEYNSKEIAEKARADDQAEFRVLDRQIVSDDEMVLNMYMTTKNANGESEGHEEKTVFEKIDGEWKISDKPVPSNP
jgi:hypothetical protein